MGTPRAISAGAQPQAPMTKESSSNHEWNSLNKRGTHRSSAIIKGKKNITNKIQKMIFSLKSK
jgi:hypothetical protein